MKTTILLFTLCVLALCSVGCKKDQPSEPQQSTPTEPAVNSGQTNAQGVAEYDLGPYRLRVNTRDSLGNSAPQIFTEAYLLDRVIVVFALDSLGRFYPSFQVVNAPLAKQISKAATTTIEPITITLTLIGVGLFLYHLYQDFERIENNGWVEAYCEGVDLSTVLFFVNLRLQALVPKSGLIVHLGPTAASKLGLQSQTITIPKYIVQGGALVFKTVLQQAFNVLDNDILRICIYTARGRQEKKMPLIKIEDVEFHRNFAYKFTLTWGENPSDLDSHLWTPSIGGTAYHVYYANRGSLTAPPYAELDLDDVDGYGPENITIKTLSSGTYKYAVYHFAGTGTITTSGARVKVFNSTGLIGEYAVPTTTSSPNWWWYVGDINGSTGSFTLRNQILSSPPQASLSSHSGTKE
jgi:hypothetical protein